MNKTTKPGFWQVTKSVFAAAIGVQSNKNRVEDFQSNSIWPFVIGGIVFTISIVVLLVVIVSLADS